MIGQEMDPGHNLQLHWMKRPAEVSDGASVETTKSLIEEEEEEQDDLFSVRSLTASSRLSSIKKTIMKAQIDEEGYIVFYPEVLIGNHYKLLGLLGKGAFGLVCRAENLHAGNLVALKVSRRDSFIHEAGHWEYRLLLEAQAAEQRHIVRALDGFSWQGHYCLATELLDTNLREVLNKYGRKIGLNMQAVQLYARHAFKALLSLRSNGIVHGDIKPDNLLLDSQKTTLKIGDFGTAMRVEEAGAEGPIPYLASRFYRAPEIMIGLRPDCAIDIWALGCSLYELCTGELLFTGKSNVEMLRQILALRGRIPAHMIRQSPFKESYFGEGGSLTSSQATATQLSLKTRISEASRSAQSLLISLLNSCLEIDPKRRITPDKALDSPFFQIEMP